MAIKRTYAQARAELKDLLDRVIDDHEAVVIRRRKGGDAVLIAAQELGGLLETIHLFRSPNNARRLLESLERSQRGKVKLTPIQQMRDEYGLDDEE
jgi:prevent-host-death family protein